MGTRLACCLLPTSLLPAMPEHSVLRIISLQMHHHQNDLVCSGTGLRTRIHHRSNNSYRIVYSFVYRFSRFHCWYNSVIYTLLPMDRYNRPRMRQKQPKLNITIHGKRARAYKGMCMAVASRCCDVYIQSNGGQSGIEQMEERRRVYGRSISIHAATNDQATRKNGWQFIHLQLLLYVGHHTLGHVPRQQHQHPIRRKHIKTMQPFKLRNNEKIAYLFFILLLGSGN